MRLEGGQQYSCSPRGHRSHVQGSRLSAQEEGYSVFSFLSSPHGRPMARLLLPASHFAPRMTLQALLGGEGGLVLASYLLGPVCLCMTYRPGSLWHQALNSSITTSSTGGVGSTTAPVA